MFITRKQTKGSADRGAWPWRRSPASVWFAVGRRAWRGFSTWRPGAAPRSHRLAPRPPRRTTRTA